MGLNHSRQKGLSRESYSNISSIVRITLSSLFLLFLGLKRIFIINDVDRTLYSKRSFQNGFEQLNRKFVVFMISIFYLFYSIPICALTYILEHSLK